MRPPLQKEKAIQFQERPPTLILPNAWDAASAYLFEQVGFRAIATTSSEVAAGLSYADGQISRAMMLEVIVGVARVSFGSLMMRAVLGRLRHFCQELLEQETYNSMSDGAMPEAEFRSLFMKAQL